MLRCEFGTEYWNVFQLEARLGIRVKVRMIAAVCIPYLGKCPSLEPWDRLHIRLKLKTSKLVSRVEIALYRSDSDIVGADLRLWQPQATTEFLAIAINCIYYLSFERQTTRKARQTGVFLDAISAAFAPKK